MATTIKLQQARKREFKIGDYDFTCPKCRNVFMVVQIYYSVTILLSFECPKCGKNIYFSKFVFKGA